jgi:hypothetical protein
MFSNSVELSFHDLHKPSIVTNRRNYLKKRRSFRNSSLMASTWLTGPFFYGWPRYFNLPDQPFLGCLWREKDSNLRPFGYEPSELDAALSRKTEKVI